MNKEPKMNQQRAKLRRREDTDTMILVLISLFISGTVIAALLLIASSLGILI